MVSEPWLSYIEQPTSSSLLNSPIFPFLLSFLFWPRCVYTFLTKFRFWRNKKKPTRLGPFVIIPLIGGGQGNSNILGANKISLNASSQISFKLAKGRGNYAFWKSQMTNLLFDFGLLGFFDGSLTCLENAGPNYQLWLRHDHLILLGIQAIVHNMIGLIINNCSSSAEAWRKQESSYLDSSNTHMLFLLTKL